MPHETLTSTGRVCRHKVLFFLSQNLICVRGPLTAPVRSVIIECRVDVVPKRVIVVRVGW
jgi:hypothetical protein